MRILEIEKFENTTNIVDEFERLDEAGNYVYDRLIINDCITSYAYMYPKLGVIIERENEDIFERYVTMSSFKNNLVIYPSVSKYWDKRLELEISSPVDILFNEEEYIHIKAQGSKDKHGFYKQYGINGKVISSKNYGHCSYYYKVIGIRIVKRF